MHPPLSIPAEKSDALLTLPGLVYAFNSAVAQQLTRKGMVVLFYWMFEEWIPKQALMDEFTAFQ